MYQVTFYNDDTEIVAHSPNVNGIKLVDAVMKTAINSVDSFEFTMFMDNPAYGKLKPFKTKVEVLNTLTGVYEFEGRVLSPTETMDSNGLHGTSFVCEGELGYLHDSQQRHLEFRGTPSDLLNTIISYHNGQVEGYKQFQIGNVTVTNNTDNLYVYLSAEQSTFETIKDKLINRIGGELQIRKENGVRYLDFLERIGVDTTTEIKLAKNLISMTRDNDPTDIITRFTPLGTRVESDNPNATDASEARLTIASVNSGKPYIDRPDLISVFGIQGGSETWDDITTESALLSAANNFMNKQKISLNQYKITAVDLSIIGLDICDFRTGNGYKLVNPIMAIDETLRIVGTSKDINNPQNSSLNIGDKFKTLYEYQNDARNSTLAINDLQSRLDRLSVVNGNLSDQLIQAQTDLGIIQQSLIDIDATNLPTELQAISGQITSLQTDLNNLNIPVYELATDISDGLMSAEDKSALDKAVMDIGNTSLLSTVETADLVLAINELVTRIETLEGGA